MQVVQKGKFPPVIDSTIRADFVSCQTKGYYSFFRQLGPKYPSIDLIAGGAFARGLEVTRKLFYGEGAQLPDAVHKGMLEALAYYDLELKGSPIPDNKLQKGPDRVVEALAYYFDIYNPAVDSIQPYMAGGQPAVEFTFSIPIPRNNPDTGEPLIVAGRFDMVGIYNGQLIGVDEKTTSQLGASWANQWNLRAQFTCYTWALQQYMENVIGMMIRGVSFLKHSFGNAESLQLRPQWMVDQWYEQLLRDVDAMLEAYKTGWFNQDFSEACAAYGGCPFQKLCTSASPETWIDGYFAPRTWNPLSKVPYEQPKTELEVIHDPLLLNLF